MQQCVAVCCSVWQCVAVTHRITPKKIGVTLLSQEGDKVPGRDRGREDEQDDQNREEIKGEIERERERDGEREERELKTAGPKLTRVFLGIRFQSFYTDLQN